MGSGQGIQDGRRRESDMAGLNNIQVYPDADAVAVAGATYIAEALRRRPSLLMCVATGESPLGIYAELGRMRGKTPELFRELRVVKLDEWGGLAMDNASTCESYIQERVLAPLGVTKDRYLGFNSDPADPEGECSRIAGLLNAWGRIDVSVLGIGLNGHLGLNEPAAVLVPGCHVAELSETAKTHSMLLANGATPRFGLTLGMGDLLCSRQILLAALGPSKRDPLIRMCAGQITTDYPASFLALHTHVIVMTDISLSSAELGKVQIDRAG